MRDVLLDRRTRERGILRPRAVERLCHEHDRLRCLNGYRLWTLVVVESWYRAVVDGARR